MSPSSRRAWIEIVKPLIYRLVCTVALLAEGVDRNIADDDIEKFVYRRPPRGGRG